LILSIRRESVESPTRSPGLVWVDFLPFAGEPSCGFQPDEQWVQRSR
jgi:hypothetical protein